MTGGLYRGGDTLYVSAYRVVPNEMFHGETMTYRNIVFDLDGDLLRGRAEGFWHGMRVKQGRGEYVLVGPEIEIRPADLEHAAAGQTALALV